jgi:hypothetical protein
MIIIDRTIQNLQPEANGEAIKVVAPLLPKVDIKQTYFCPCDIAGYCEYINKVFADLEDADEYKNDKTSLLFRKYIVSDSIVIKLIKDGQELTTINDNTLGEYYNGVEGNSDYIGFICDWRKVLQTYGVGEYQFLIEKTIIGTQTSDYSIKYYLLPFTNENADKTVKLEWYQNGSIRSSEFDYTGINWYRQIRLRGIFWKETPTLEVDNYVNENYEIEQIQDKINFEYDFSVDFIPSEVGEQIINDAILGNDIFITDYNLNNYRQYLKFDVQPVSIDGGEETDLYNRKQFIIKFTKRLDNHIKTNY